MDKETLIRGLNQDLAHVNQETRKEMKKLLAEIQDELRHAQFLADKIAALGGKPTTQPAPVPEAATPRAMLEAVLQAEKETIARYVERMKQAEAYGDYGLANDLQEIISEETRHKEETEKLLKGTWQE